MDFLDVRGAGGLYTGAQVFRRCCSPFLGSGREQVFGVYTTADS